MGQDSIEDVAVPKKNRSSETDLARGEAGGNCNPLKPSLDDDNNHIHVYITPHFVIG